MIFRIRIFVELIERMKTYLIPTHRLGHTTQQTPLS